MCSTKEMYHYEVSEWQDSFDRLVAGGSVAFKLDHLWHAAETSKHPKKMGYIWQIPRSCLCQPKRQLFDFMFASFMVPSATVLPYRSMVWYSFSFSLWRQNPSLDMERWHLDLHFSWGLEIWFMIQQQGILTCARPRRVGTRKSNNDSNRWCTFIFRPVQTCCDLLRKHHIDDAH